METKGRITDFKITVDVTRDSGKDVTEYTGSAFMLAVVEEGKGMYIESRVTSAEDSIRLIAGAIASVVGIARNNGVDIAEILDIVSTGASIGVSEALEPGSHNCTNCGKCGKPKAN